MGRGAGGGGGAGGGSVRNQDLRTISQASDEESIHHYQQYWDNLHEFEKEKHEVSDSHFEFITEKLISGQPLTQKEQAIVDRLHRALDNQPTQTGTVWRGLYFDSPADRMNFAYNAIPGSTILFKHFSSTSTDKRVAAQFSMPTRGKTTGEKSILLKIQSKTGKSLQKVSQGDYSALKEVLFRPQTQFRVIGRDIKAGTGLVEISLQEI